nr:DUF3848 domain-containing protein [uncultured Lachnoclostridium sp.]
MKLSTQMLREILYCAIVAEQKKYREWLLHLPPQEILYHTREYSIREDIIVALEQKELTEAQVKALMQSSTPLADIVRYVWNVETNEMDVIMDSIEILADDILKECNKE